MGETLGPVLGSVFKVNFGFRTSQDIIALTLITFMILYYLVCGRSRIFDKALPAPHEEKSIVIDDIKAEKVLEPLINSLNQHQQQLNESNHLDKYLLNQSTSSLNSINRDRRSSARVSIGSKVHFFNQYAHQNFAQSHTNQTQHTMEDAHNHHVEVHGSTD